MTPALRALMNRHAMPAFERQLALLEMLGQDHGWKLSLKQGTATFEPGGTFPVQLLGSRSDESNTWLWAWANEGAHVPKPLLVAAKKVKAVGKKRNVEEFEREELPLEIIDAHTLALVAAAVGELAAYYRFPYEGGALFAGLDAGALKLPEADTTRMATVIREVLERWDVDPRLAIQNYVDARGGRVEATRERIVARWEDGRVLTATFDAAGKLADVQPGGESGATAGHAGG